MRSNVGTKLERDGAVARGARGSKKKLERKREIRVRLELD